MWADLLAALWYGNIHDPLPPWQRILRLSLVLLAVVVLAAVTWTLLD